MTVACERIARVLVIALVAAASAAQAQTPSPNQAAADEAFKAGRDLYKAGKYAEACEQFEKSQKLDPANGTLFNLSQCSEKVGKLATAAAGYRELITKDTNDQRKATAAERLKEITPKIPKLIVKVDKPPPGIVVEIDSKTGPRGIPANTPIEVDVGEYSVVARARGYNEFMSRVKIAPDGKTTAVEATLEAGASNTETVGIAPRQKGPDKPRNTKKLLGIGGMATGGAALVGGIVLGSLARSKWNDAKAVCGGLTCTTQADVDRANDLGDQAHTKATWSTVFLVAGVAIGGAGTYLFLTAPAGTTITPTASDHSAGVTLSGQF
ncbi:MAG TPA: tetratricopeptide repeat protein [Kofleriaceae bacterium]|nr:tetratricopeptide repeat protein [Kofleriaceae bacterium]